MNKEQLILLLKKYKENRAKLKLKLRDKEGVLRKIENISKISLSATNYEDNGDIHSKNKISDKVGNNASDNVDIKVDLQKELENIEKDIKELSTKLEEVEIRLEALRYKEREVLIAYYIDGCTYEDIGNRVYYRLFGQTRSTRNIQDIVEKATQKMLKI